jgi:hypothetical protein
MTARSAVDYLSGWKGFITELEEEILPIYLGHERSFDPWGVHGRMHICRSVLFSELMARFYYHNAMETAIDFYAVRVATALHDSGRQANGVDLWEQDSQRNCVEYVERRATGTTNAAYPSYVAGLIRKQQSGEVAGWVVYDADVLEIMRPCCGHGGLDGFRRDYLHFLGGLDARAAGIEGAGDVREAFIREAWNWIQATEQVKLRLHKETRYMQRLLEKLEQEKEHYPRLSTLL